MWPRGWAGVKLYSSMTAALEGSEWSAARPDRTLPSGKTRYPFYRRLGGPQGRSGWAENLPHREFFVRYDFIQCSMVVCTRDTMETRNLVVMSYYLLCSVLCSLGHYVASWTFTLSGSICDVAVRHFHILIVARGLGTWASACRHVRVLHPVLLHAHNGLVTFPCL